MLTIPADELQVLEPGQPLADHPESFLVYAVVDRVGLLHPDHGTVDDVLRRRQAEFH